MSAKAQNAQKKKPRTPEQKALRREKRRLKKAARAAQGFRAISVVPQGKAPPQIGGNINRVTADSKTGSLMSPSQRRALIAYARSLMTGNSTGQHALIPRQVPVPVSPAPLKHVMDLPYMNWEDGVVDPRQGLAGIEVYRSITCPLRVWTIENAGATTYTTIVSKQTPLQGFWPSDGTTLDEGLINDHLELDTADVLNVVGLVDHGAVGEGYSSFMRKFKAANGTVAYGVPIDWTGTTDITINFQLVGVGYLPNPSNIEMRLVSASGATSGWVASSNPVSTNTTHVTSGTFTFTGGVTALGGAFSCCLPGSPMGIQIRASGSTMYIMALRLSWTTSATAKLGWMKPTPLSNLASYNWVQTLNFATLRAWVEYVGSDLLNAGTIAAATCPGGGPAPLLGYVDFDSVASLQKSYNDAVKKGDWSFFKPHNAEDYDMLPLNDVLAAALRTSFVIWCQIGAPQQGQSGQPRALKLELVGDIEATTQDNTRPIVECEANPLALNLLLAMMYYVHEHMENPLHWKDISAVLSKIGSKIKGGAEFIAKNKDWLIPAALTVAKGAGVALAAL